MTVVGDWLPVDNDSMDRLSDEMDYVLEVLARMRSEVIEHPELFDPHAKEKIDEAIAYLDGVREHLAAAA